MRNELLPVLEAEISRRTGSILAAVPDWPCRKGCDYCCRHLATLPLVTEPEWEQIQAGLAQLGPDVRNEANLRLEHLISTGAPRPVTCPYLEPSSSSCLIYAHRPLACRTYGFYRERDRGQYCETIEQMNPDVVWGNAESLDTRAEPLGPRHDLAYWYRCSCGPTTFENR